MTDLEIKTCACGGAPSVPLAVRRVKMMFRIRCTSPKCPVKVDRIGVVATIKAWNGLTGSPAAWRPTAMVAPPAENTTSI